MDEGGTTYPKPATAWLTVALLCLFYVLSLMDRNILSLLIDPIKRDFGLTDVQISLLYGVAFVVPYAVAAFPFGWAVDRFSRRSIIFSGVVFWSMATAACGLSRNFATLFMARATVGMGEAAIAPASQSILADTFPPHKLSLPMTLWGGCAKLGAGASFVISGGLIALFSPNENYVAPLIGTVRGWQLVFIMAGLAGVALALLIYLIPEPPRVGLAPRRAAARHGPTYVDYFRFFWTQRRMMVNLHIAVMLMISVAIAILTWTAPFLIRVHQWPVSYTGFILGPVLAVGPLLCLPIHGILVDRAFGRGVRDAQVRHMAWMAGSAAPLAATAFLVGSPWLTLGFVTLIIMLTVGYVGLSAAALQITVPPTLRGKAASISLLLGVTAGQTLGSTAPALISENFLGGPMMIGAAVSLYSGGALAFAALFYVLSRKGMREALA